MLPIHLEKGFPKLRLDGAKKTSEASIKYNCIAWSATRTKKNWFEPKPTAAWEIWPNGIPDDYSLDSFILIFEKRGYKRCTEKDTSFEFFYKKVAIYAAFGIYGQPQWEFTHVSDQLHSGAWTSKLGKDIDIQHNTPHSLAGDVGDEYGTIFKILKRRCWPWELLARVFFKIKSHF
jgi:hypothetical protein